MAPNEPPKVHQYTLEITQTAWKNRLNSFPKRALKAPLTDPKTPEKESIFVQQPCHNTSKTAVTHGKQHTPVSGKRISTQEGVLFIGTGEFFLLQQNAGPTQLLLLQNASPTQGILVILEGGAGGLPPLTCEARATNSASK